MSTAKRLIRYAAACKQTIIIALVLLSVAAAAELTGPIIAKRMIDVHILGIERPWYESSQGEAAVLYKGHWYKRSDHFAAAEPRGEEIRILQVGSRYVFVPEAVDWDGKRTYADNRLTVSKNQRQAVYPAVLLTKGELFSFYQPEIQGMIRLILIYIGLILAASFFQYGQKFLLLRSANRVLQWMRNDVFRQVHRLPVRYFDNLAAGKIVSRITNDTEVIRDLYVAVLATFFSSGIYIVGIYTAMFLLHARMALICLPILPALFLWVRLYRHFAEKYNHVIRARLSDINGIINEVIQGIPVIRVFRRQKQVSAEFEQLNEEYFMHQNKLLRLNSFTSYNLIGAFRNVVFIALIWYFGSAYLHGGALLTVGVLYAFVDYINRLFQPVTDVVNQLANLEQARVAASRVFELMDEPGVDVADGQMERYKGNVRFEQVRFAYKEADVLKNIDFEASHGETVALVGHTGSGKSSIINLLFRFYDPRQGRILVDGQNTRDIPPQSLRRHMGIVLQDPFLFTGTIASNVSLNDPRITRGQVEQAIRDVGAEAMFRKLPQGLDEPVLEKGSTLSAGQRQLISFARALAFDPAILILDEATSNIDTETEILIQQALEVLKKGRTTFIIAHRLSTIRNADQILMLHKGEIVERGNHSALMKLRGRYYQMVQLQQHSGTTA